MKQKAIDIPLYSSHLSCMMGVMLENIYENKILSSVPHPVDKRFMDLTGIEFGRLTVLGYAGTNDGGYKQWFCLCECGKIAKVRATRLRSGSTRSCGCLAAELAGQRMTIHGQCRQGTATFEYNSYMSAYGRCSNPNNIDYHNYGGRGIKFLFENFSQFIDHIGSRPTPKHSLDRIDIEGHYQIGNVRWASAVEQSNNKRNNLFLTIMGETKTLTQWCNFDNKHRVRAGQRIRKGWCSKCAIFNPLRKMCEHR